MSHREQRCVRDIMERNLVGSQNRTVGIITPYNNQRHLLAGSLSRMMKKYERTEDIEDDVVTVHRSQGREWDVVLFSLVDSYEERFFTDSMREGSLHLINTAVSRARKLLILIGDAEDWKGRNGQLISDLFGVAEEVGREIRFEDYLPAEEEADSV